jgi:hypothetical protein
MKNKLHRTFDSAGFFLLLLLAPINSLVPLVETRRDQYGGTGLFSKSAVNKGEPLIAVTLSERVLEATPLSVIDTVVDKLAMRKEDKYDAKRGSWSIGATLATWKLLNDGNMASEDNLHLLGVSTATHSYAKTLPWEKIKWQLPILWDSNVFFQSIIEGCEQVTESGQDVSQEAEKMCRQVSRMTDYFHYIGHFLAGELGLVLEKKGFHFLQSDIEKACEHSLALVFSRAFTCSSGEIVMLPTIDVANHNNVPNAILQNTKHGLTLLAAESISLNQEITISYGFEEGEPNAFAGYGFIPNGWPAGSDGEKALQQAILWGQERTKQDLLLCEN